MSECISFSLLLLLLVVSFLLAGLGWLLCLFSGNTPHQSAFALPQRTPESDFDFDFEVAFLSASLAASSSASTVLLLCHLLFLRLVLLLL